MLLKYFPLYHVNLVCDFCSIEDLSILGTITLSSISSWTSSLAVSRTRRWGSTTNLSSTVTKLSSWSLLFSSLVFSWSFWWLSLDDWSPLMIDWSEELSLVVDSDFFGLDFDFILIANLLFSLVRDLGNQW